MERGSLRSPALPKSGILTWSLEAYSRFRAYTCGSCSGVTPYFSTISAVLVAAKTLSGRYSGMAGRSGRWGRCSSCAQRGAAHSNMAAATMNTCFLMLLLTQKKP